MGKTKKEILNFWERLAISKPSGNLVTHRDLNQVNIEISAILQLLDRRDEVLDVGCGNGFATCVYSKKCARTVGMDYSKNMIKAARRAYKGENLSFVIGNVLEKNFADSTFTAIVSTRCLINLTSWGEQMQAIRNMHRILRKGGRLILTEGIQQGRANLNGLRKKIGLKNMPRVWHNIDFDERKLFPFLRSLFIVKRDIRFGLYDVLARANYPACIYPKEPKYATKYQSVAEKLFYELGEGLWAEYSREACLELVKR